MAISVTSPVGPGIDRAREVCFRPFGLGKWFVLGFCAWLAGLGEGGGGANFRFNIGGSGRSGPGGGSGQPPGAGEFLRQAKDWVSANMGLVILIVIAGLVLVFGLWVLLLWLSSRGKFMFLDGVVTNRAAVAEPWRRFREHAFSLFKFRLVLAIIGSLLALPGLVLAGLAVWPCLETENFAALEVAGFAGAAFYLFAVGVVFVLVKFFLNEFVVPIMYARGQRVMGAWRDFRRLASGNAGVFVLYVLFRILIGIAVGILAFIARVLPCCIGFLPYLGTVIVLPLLVFKRAYPLYFLGQFGEPYRLLPERPAA